MTRKVYVIKNTETGEYLKHNGNYDPYDYPYKNVKKPEDAEHFPSKEHADYAEKWYADTREPLIVEPYELNEEE